MDRGATLPQVPPMTDLSTRPGLPDALRVLLDGYPRSGWEAHRHFDGLVRFWLERHLAFRELLGLMTADAQAALGAAMDPETFARRLSRLGGHFVDSLHGHHQIEDGHYFPLLAQLERRLQKGFDLLDGDHHQLSGHLDSFADTANAVLRGWREPGHRERTGAFLTLLGDSTRFLDRHLTDEEELIVPIILAHGPDRLGG